MDVAASEFHNHETGLYELSKSGQGTKTTDEMIDMYAEWVEKYPIVSIEDGLGERDVWATRSSWLVTTCSLRTLRS